MEVVWWFLLIVVVGGALAYAYWEHRKQSRRFTDLFKPLAIAHNGEVRAATLLALPQLSFERDGLRYLIGAMATGASHVAGSASRPGASGPFTFAELVMPHDTCQELTILRTDRIDRATRRLLETATQRRHPISGDPSFDEAFGIKTTDEAFALQVVDPALRGKLLNTSHQRLELVLTGAKVTVRIDDYVKSAGDLDEMIEIAACLADNCAAP